MKIMHKLILGFMAVVFLIWVVGYLAVRTSQKALEKSIIDSSISLVTEILNEIDRAVYRKIEVFQEYSRDLILQDAVLESNQEFEKLDNIQAYIDKRDKEWTSAPKEEIMPFIEGLLNNRSSEELREKLEFYKDKYGYRVFGEVFTTNRYGAIASLTGKTTDYRQDDKEWWQVTMKDGLYIGDVGYDESAGMHSIDIGIRVDDEDGNFIGVMKVILNIEVVVNIMKGLSESGYKTAHFKLITKDGRLVYSTMSFEFLEDASYLLQAFGHNYEELSHYVLREGYEEGEGKELSIYAHSKEYKGFKGVGWNLIVSYATEEIFAPVTELRDRIIVISSGLTIFALLIAIMISRYISKPVKKLRDAAIEIGKGNLNTRIEVKSNDEIGEFASTFTRMVERLKATIVSRDEEISERKQAEKKLKRSKEFAETVLNSMNDAISIIDVRDFTIKGVNSFFLKAVGLKEEEVLGKPCYEITHHRYDPCTPPDDICPLMDTVSTGEHSVAEHVHYTGTGQKIYAEITTSPIKDENGKVTQVVHVARDITERKHAEEKLKSFTAKLQQSNSELRDFLYIASHDLQEPLRKVQTFGDRLKAKYSDSLGDQGKDYLKRMQNAAGRMRTLINDLLMFSRVTTRAQPFVPVDLSTVAKEVLSDLEVRIEQVKGRVEVGDLPAIDADPLQMRQLFQNLIGNALKFHRKEEPPVVKINAQIVKSPDSGSSDDEICQISVQDNGIGFDENYTDRIFGVFQRLHGRSEYEGSGMGLSVCRKIVERHSGNITAKSTPGQGTTFIVTLPVKQSKGGNG